MRRIADLPLAVVALASPKLPGPCARAAHACAGDAPSADDGTRKAGA